MDAIPSSMGAMTVAAYGSVAAAFIPAAASENMVDSVTSGRSKMRLTVALRSMLGIAVP